MCAKTLLVPLVCNIRIGHTDIASTPKTRKEQNQPDRKNTHLAGMVFVSTSASRTVLRSDSKKKAPVKPGEMTVKVGLLSSKRTALAEGELSAVAGSYTSAGCRQ